MTWIFVSGPPTPRVPSYATDFESVVLKSPEEVISEVSDGCGDSMDVSESRRTFTDVTLSERGKLEKYRPRPNKGATENARPENAGLENDGQKLRGLENAGLENDGQNFSKLWAKLRGLKYAGLENDGPC